MGTSAIYPDSTKRYMPSCFMFSLKLDYDTDDITGSLFIDVLLERPVLF